VQSPASIAAGVRTGTSLGGADLADAILGKDPPVAPSGWIITDPKTGELRRATAPYT
jgi:hypothetical protein